MCRIRRLCVVCSGLYPTLCTTLPEIGNSPTSRYTSELRGPDPGLGMKSKIVIAGQEIVTNHLCVDTEEILMML